MKSYHKKMSKNLQGGFTLIELMVSLTIFSIVMLISTGTLLIMIDVNAKAQAIYSATSNLTFATDNITREIRTGYSYYCGDNPPADGFDLPEGTRDCTGGDIFIAFTKEEDKERVGYRLNGTQIEQKMESSSWLPLTSEDVIITKFEITTKNTDTYYPSDGDVDQPTADLFITGYVNNGLDTDTDFTIQSHVTQRRLDII